MTGQKTMITLRIQVTITYGGKRPQRVRVVAKDRGALVFPYRRELACVPLYKAAWRRVAGDEGGCLWQNEQAVAVPMDMSKMLRYRNLALQLYCLRGSDVKHKGVFNFRRVMQQQQREDELLLAMRYSAARWWRCLVFPCLRGCEDEAVPLRGGSEEQRRGAAATSTLPQALPPASVPHLDPKQRKDGPNAAQHASSGSSPAADCPTTAQHVGSGRSVVADGPTAAQHAGSGSSPAADCPTMAQYVGSGRSVVADGPTAAQHAGSGPSPAADCPTTAQHVGSGRSVVADGPTAAQHAGSGSSPAADCPTTAQHVGSGRSVADDGPTAAQHANSATVAVQQLRGLPPPRPVRFPDSDAMSPELLREYDLRVAEEETKAQKEAKRAEQTVRPLPGVRSGGQARHAAPWMAGGVAVVGGTLWHALAGNTQPLSWLGCGLAAAIMLTDVCVQTWVWRRRCGAVSTGRHACPAEGDPPTG